MELAQRIFDDLDQNDDGTVTIDEFVQKYLEKQVYLREKIDQVCKRIVDHKRQYDAMVENREKYRNEN